MKHFYSLTTLLLLLIVGSTTAQNNNVFNYQAVAHDANYDTVLRNKAITVDFYITTDDSDPINNYEYTEQHQLTTNNYGLFNVQIGDSDPSLFSTLDWVNNSYYLGVAIDNLLIGTQLLVAVPFALHANSASQTANASTVNNLTVESAVPADASFSDNQTLIITADSLIISNGNGVSLDSISSNDNDWIVDGNNIENGNSGNVGIGNTTLFGKLNVTTDANTTRAIYIENNTSSNSSEKMGVYAMVNGGGTSDNTGAWFDVMGNATGTNIAVGGYASGTAGENRGVYGNATNGTTNWAGYFDGNVKVRDNLVLGTATNPSQLQYKDGNQGFGKVLRSDAQGNAQWSSVGSLAAGVMLKPIYDSSNNGIVDNAELVNGYQVNSNVPANATFTDNQTIILDQFANTLSISNGNVIDLSSYANIENIDNDTTNEIQSLTISNNTIQLSSGGGSVTVPNNVYIDGSNVGVATSFNTTGDFNTATGSPSLTNITSGTGNSAYGDASLINTSTGSHNSAYGRWSLGGNSTGSNNTAMGHDALKNNQTGSNNTAIGKNANVGSSSLNNATAIGADATVDISNAMVLGNNVSVGIATSSPTEKLDVNGHIRMRAGGSTGYIPVSDNNGVMTWTSPDSLSLSSSIKNLSDGFTDQIDNLYLSSNVSPNLNSGSYNNIAIGQGSLDNNSGNNNISIGINSLSQNTTGYQNVAVGSHTLENNTTSYGNVAVGPNALNANTTGNQNVGIGEGTLSQNTTGSQNTAIGASSLSANTTGSSNVSVGLNSLHQNVDGASNTATGYQSLISNINGSQNTATGMNALEHSTGSNNTALGYNAGGSQTNSNQNTFLGYNANVATGGLIYTAVNNSTAVGANTILKQSNTVILGDNSNVGIGTSLTGHNSGAERYLTISSGNGSLSSAGEATSLELIGGTSSGELQNRIDFIARATDNNNYTTGRIEMTGSNDVSGSTKYGIMKFHTKAREAGGNNSLTERMSIDNYGKITFGTSNNSYTFPTSRGSDGQVLRISHSTPGQLEWQNVGPTTNEINLSPHDFNTVTSVVYGGYYRNVIQLGNGGGTNEGSNHYDFPTPSDWDGSSMTVTVYYSSDKNDGNITFSLTGESYSIGQSGYVSTGVNNSLNVAQPYTLYSYTKTLYFGSNTGGSDLLSLMFSRYDYQYSGNPNQDTNTGYMFIHGIKISYPTN